MGTIKINASDDILGFLGFFFGKKMPRNRSDAQRSISLYHPKAEML